MTSSYARPGRVAGRRPVARPGPVGRKSAPLPMALRIGILGLVVLLVAGLGATVLHFVGGSVIAAFNQQAEWRGGYTAQFLVKNDTKSELRTWKMEFELPEGSKVLRHWGATMTAKGGKYVFERDDANLERGDAARFQFIVQGSGKPANCRLNDGPCDQGDDSAAPTTPSGLRVAGASVSSVRLAWQPSTDNTAVSTYRVYMDGKLAASTSGTSTTISRLDRGARHEFVVSAVDMKGNESARSAAVSATTKTSGDTRRPTAPTRLVASEVTTASAAIKWKPANDNVGVVGYKVYEGDAVVGTSAKPGATITGLSAASTHTFRVTAIDAAENESQRSAPIKLTTARVGARVAQAAPPQGSAVRKLQAQSPEQFEQISLLTQQVSQQAQITQQLQQQAQQAELQVSAARQQAEQIDLQLEQQAQQARFQIEQAEQQAAQIQQQVGVARQQAGQVAGLARKAQQDAQEATERAREASADAERDPNAQLEAQQLVQQALQLQQNAQQLGQQAAQAQAQIQAAEQQAQQASFQVEQVQQQATQIQQQAGQARQQAAQQIGLAEDQARQAREQADEAQRALDQALKELSEAQGGKPAGTGSGSGGTGRTAGAPAQPRLSVVDVTDSTVTLRWTAAGGGAGVEGYDVLQDGAVVQQTGPSTTTTVVTGLESESAFSFSVVARGRNGTKSEPSNVAEAATVAAGFDDSATPANLHASCVTNRSVSLDWDAPAEASDVAAYDVYAQGRMVASVRGTSATIDGFRPGESVQFVVKSRDSAGLNSPPSRVVTVSTLQDGGDKQRPIEPSPRVTTQSGSELSGGYSGGVYGLREDDEPSYSQS